MTEAALENDATETEEVVAPPDVDSAPETEQAESPPGNDEEVSEVPAVEIPQDVLDVLAGVPAGAPPQAATPAPSPQLPPDLIKKLELLGQQQGPQVDDDLVTTDPARWFEQRVAASGLATAQQELQQKIQQTESRLAQMNQHLQGEQQQRLASARQRLNDATRSHFSDTFGRSPLYTGDEKVRNSVNGQYKSMMESAITHAERTGDVGPIHTMSDWRSAEMVYAAGLIASGQKISELTRSGQPLKVKGAEPTKGKAGQEGPGVDDYFDAEDIAELKAEGWSDARISQEAADGIAAQKRIKKGGK